jgi:hypothetical protein
VSFVDTPISTCENSIALLFIIDPFSLILIAPSRAFLPYSLPVSQASFEISFEKTATGPKILTITRRLSIFVVSLISIAICEALDTLAVFETVAKLSLIAIAISPGMHTIALSPPLLPFSNVGVSL